MLASIVFSFILMFIFLVYVPDLWWLGGVIAVLLLVLWKILTKGTDKQKKSKEKYDEFDWWQDDQGL